MLEGKCPAGGSALEGSAPVDMKWKTVFRVLLERPAGGR